ncbi:hypothetical protein D3C72_1549590 [compost metagenome]
MPRDGPAWQHFVAGGDDAVWYRQIGQQARLLDQHQQFLALGFVEHAVFQIDRQIAPAQAHAALHRPCQRHLFLLADGYAHRVLATGVSRVDL